MSRTAYHHHRQPEYHRVGGASTILPSDQPPPRQLSLSILPGLAPLLRSLSVSFARYPLRSSRKTKQAGRVPLAFARSGLLIRPRRCASRARAVSTLPLKSATRMPRETKAWGFRPPPPPRGKWNASGRMLLVLWLSHHQLPTRTSPGYQTFTTWPTKDSSLSLLLWDNASPTTRDLSKM